MIIERMNTKPAAQRGIATLYHYDRFEDRTRLERILNDNAVYCSNPNDFNDPWDCKPHFSKTLLSVSEKYEAVLHWFDKTSRKCDPSIPAAERKRRIEILRNDRPRLELMMDQLNLAIVSAVLAQYRVYCLSTHANRALMWSHYAHSHRGYCLEFSVQNELICGALPVDYVENYPEFDVLDNSLDGALRTLLTKSKDWSYENEYRLIVAAPGYSFPDIPPTQDNFVALPAGALKSIIVGCQMPDGDRAYVRAFVERSGRPVLLKAAHRVSNSYALDIRPTD